MTPNGSPNKERNTAPRSTWAAAAILAAGLVVFYHGAALAAPYIYSVAIIDKSGTDANGDGYWETYEFDIEIDADVGPLASADVSVVIWCLTTGDSFEAGPWDIYGNELDPVVIHFTEYDFTVLEPSLLYFSVELWNADFTQQYLPSQEGLPGEPIWADSPGCGALLYSAEIVGLVGQNADAGGYFETFSFDIGVDADTGDDCTVDVAARIECTTTGQSWRTTSWPITGWELDEQLVPFTQDDFDLSGPAELQFTVELYDPSFNTKYDELVVIDTVKARPPDCSASLVGASIQNLRDKLDEDTNGFLEQYGFDIIIDVDAPACSRSVTAEVACPATGQQWISPAWLVSGTGDADSAVMTFDSSEIAVTGQTELNFTVRIWDAAHTSPLSDVTDVSGGPIKAEPSSWTGFLTVHGTVQYRHQDGTLRPVRYAWVDIMEGSVVKENTATGAEGKYLRVVRVERPSDIHIRVRTESASGYYPGASSSIATVKAPGAPGAYYAQTTAVWNEGSDLLIDLLIDNTGDNAGAFNVYDSIVEGHHQTATWLGSPLSYGVIALWPDDGTYYDGTSISMIELDQWDSDVILHEYGHFIADQFGFLESPGGDHYWDRDLRIYPEPRSNLEAAQLTFSEAWADFFAVAAQYAETNDANYDDTGDMDVSDSLESDTEKHYSPGEYYESMVACSFWDMFDDNNDAADNEDYLAAPITDIWTVLRVDKPDTMSRFWQDWQSRNGYKVQMTRILRDHEMSFLPDGCTVGVMSNIPDATFVLTEQDSEPIYGTAPAVYSDMPPGNYSISWDPATCHAAPADSTRAVLPGQTITFPGMYTQNDCAPPEPNAFASIQATGTDRVLITSQTATDDSPPAHYRIEAEFYNGTQWVTGGGGATTYEWSQTRPNGWVDDGLQENALYRYHHYVRDSAAEPNASGPESASVVTLLGPPADGELTIGDVTPTTAVVSAATPPKPSGAGETAAWFDIITGEGAGTGAVDRLWADSYSVPYQDLLPDTEYGWRVKYRGFAEDVSAYNPNEKKVRTLAATPGRPTVVQNSGSTTSLLLDPGGNPDHTLFAIKCTAADPIDSSYDQQWVGPCGRASAEPAWMTAEDWATVAATKLQPQTAYSFAAKAKNAAGVETALGPAADAQTTIDGDINGDCMVNIIDLVSVRNYLNRAPCSSKAAARADLNADGTVNIVDMVYCRGKLNKVCPDE